MKTNPLGFELLCVSFFENSIESFFSLLIQLVQTAVFFFQAFQSLNKFWLFRELFWDSPLFHLQLWSFLDGF